VGRVGIPAAFCLNKREVLAAEDDDFNDALLDLVGATGDAWA